MSADKDARIAALEQFINLIAPLGVIECACCRKPTPVIEEGVDHICQPCVTEGLKRKLAEQQAALFTIRAIVAGCDSEEATRTIRHLQKHFDNQHAEFDKLLAKAKEEGRKVAVPVTHNMELTGRAKPYEIK